MSPSEETKQTVTGVKTILGYLLTGIATLVPVIGTILLIKYIYRAFLWVGETLIVGGIFRFLNYLRGENGVISPWEFRFPGDDLVLLAIPLFLFFLIGWSVRNRLGGKVLSLIDGAMMRLPLLGFIYGALKQFVDAARNLGGPRKFKGVAYVEYPSPGCRLLGFITSNYFDSLQQKEVTSIFVPTSPNPATGFVIIVDDEKVMHSDLTLEEAGKLILSAGLVHPEKEHASI